MNGDACYLGCPLRVVESLKFMNVRLNAEVAEQVNDTEELVLLNNFAKETNEYLFKKCLQERIADISSWQWVLEDLRKRLTEAIDALRYEKNTIVVVLGRLKNEIRVRCQRFTRPGAFKPMSDGVEDAIIQECDFLHDEKKKFGNMTLLLNNQIDVLQKTRKKINKDILDKQQTLNIEESCSKISIESFSNGDKKKPKKKKVTAVENWQSRCESLKKTGLEALGDALELRQQARAARVHLSIAAQSYSARVDSAIRKRLHINQVKLQDLKWEKDEAQRDYNALEEELLVTEKNIVETMEQERVINARLKDRNLRPVGELTRDEVDNKLRSELSRLRNFLRQLRNNHNRITTLQANLTDCMFRFDGCIEDILQVIRIDEDRISKRNNEEPAPSEVSVEQDNIIVEHSQLSSITEEGSLPKSEVETSSKVDEEEEDEPYPFDD